MLSYFFYAVLLSFALERGLFILYLSETGLNITDIEGNSYNQSLTV
jgi:hypothetical protein